MAILIVLLVIHSIIAIWMQARIVKTDYLDFSKKIINSVLLWTIPFLWAFIINSMIQPPTKGTAHTKKDRKKRRTPYRGSSDLTIHE